MQTNHSIQILPDFIANQIAAGEVVQRPESIVKELVENAIDAGADTVSVVARDAGKQLIHIVDNGKGMSREDLLLSIRRHATSKIRSAEDLQKIQSLGFRGEALASIASVANLEIRTRRPGDEHGWRLTATPQREAIVEACSMDPGTQVFVRNLFFNVPARRKFLRSNLTEFRHIADTMLKFALCRHQLRFVFFEDDALMYDLKPAAPQARIGDVLGAQFAEALLPIEEEPGPVRVHGFTGQPGQAKKTRAHQFFFLNGRSIISRQLNHAVMTAYEHLLEKGQFPPFVLYLELDPERVDVNVHPQKHEVKFEDDRLAYNAVQRAVVSALRRHNLAPEAQFSQHVADTPFEKISFGEPGKARQTALVNRLTGEVLEGGGGSSAGGTAAAGRMADQRERSAPITQRELSAYEALFGTDSNSARSEPEVIDSAAPRSRQDEVSAKFTWQLHKKYILQQTADGLSIVDQQAAHRRILFDRAMRAIQGEMAYSQELLFPVRLSLDVADRSLLKELEPDLVRLGFVMEAAEDESFEIRAIPFDVRSGGEESALRELLDAFREIRQLGDRDERRALAASYAAKAAIRSGERMSVEAMKALLEDLSASESPHFSPDGRPIAIELSLEELDRRFGKT